MENDSSDDDILYSINSDISDIDSDEVKNDSVNDESDSPCKSSDDECVSTNNKNHEAWSGESLKSNLPSYDSKLQLLPEFQSNLGTTASTSYRQYMPKKPTTRGFKVWTRCGVSGFMYEMILYRGAIKTVSSGPSLPDSSLKCTSRSSSTTTVPKDDNTSNSHHERLFKDYGVSGMMVLDLIKNVTMGSSIFIDNYFSSTKLIKKLTELGYRVTCTLRPNRIQGCSISTEKQFNQKNRSYYEYFISDNNKCVVIAWKDPKRVLLGSNHIGTEPETMIERWDKEKRCTVDIKASQIIKQCNKFMGGVLGFLSSFIFIK
ncbi:unnamed protein product [Rotaria magnacalcarata]|nr:unnamed protein product [Rotaria magnacalcarata]CAF4224167.1 unnamed protein product [Rotaria magnacalcarata]CAF4263954.1 unnamed protein product [Rotaria magnacalcarata]